MEGLFAGLSQEAQIFVAGLIVVATYAITRWLRTRKGPHVPMPPETSQSPQNQGADKDHELGDQR